LEDPQWAPKPPCQCCCSDLHASERLHHTILVPAGGSKEKTVWGIAASNSIDRTDMTTAC
jgi:hypothetical protein